MIAKSITILIVLFLPLISYGTDLYVGYDIENNLYLFGVEYNLSKDIWRMNLYFNIDIRTYLGRNWQRFYSIMDVYDISTGIDFNRFIFEFQHISEHIIIPIFRPRYWTVFKVGVQF